MMSELEKAIETSIRSCLEAALLDTSKPSESNPHSYPGGYRAYIDVAVGMRMNEIRQFLHGKEEVCKHLDKLCKDRKNRET